MQVAGIFEKFTEKAIKAVMLAQNFAQKMGASEVSTPVQPALTKPAQHNVESARCPSSCARHPAHTFYWESQVPFKALCVLQTSAEYLFLGLLSEEPASKVCLP